MMILSKSKKCWLIVLTAPLLTGFCNGWTIPARTVAKRSISSRNNILLPRSSPGRESHPQQRRISSLFDGRNSRLDTQRSHPSRNSRRRRRLWFIALLTGSTLVAALMSPKSAAAAASTIAQQGLPTTATTTAYQIQSLQSPVSPLVELQLTLRLLFSALLGAAVGKERSSTHKHSAGVRTMALVSLGACAFTVCSSFGFSMFGRYDPSRMASNVASGVGFVGAGVITTTSATNSMDSRHSIVHGLTTATAIWISAAIGVACGVGMFYISTVATASTITILKFGRKKKANRKNIEQQGWELSPVDNRKGPASGEYFHPEPEIPTRSMSLTTTVSLDKLNESDDWDSHYEKHDESDDEEEEDEGVHEEEEDNHQKIVSRRKRFDMQNDKELAEYHESAQASILEHAHAASWGNVTELVSNYNKRGNGEEEEEELLVEATTKRQETAGQWNETLAP